MCGVESMQAIECYKDLVFQLENGNLQEAQSIVEEVSQNSNLEKRIADHMKAKICLHHKKYREGAKILRESCKSHGPNIVVLADLLKCYYQMNDGPSLLETLMRLENELKECSKKISGESLSSCHFLMASIYEEMGEMDLSLKRYREVFKSQKDQPTKVAVHSCAGILRCKILFFKELDPKNTYFQLLDLIQESGISPSRRIEEILLQGMVQVNGLKESIKELNQYGEKEFSEDFWFEILEQLIRKKESKEDIKLFLESYAKNLKPKNDLQSILIQMASGQEISQTEFIKLYQYIPLGQFLKVYLLSKGSDSKWAYFVISGLSVASQRLWRSMYEGMATESTHKQNVLQLKDSRIVSDRGQSIDLRRKKNLRSILDRFTEKQSISKVELIKGLWGVEEINDSYEERLRLAIRRANKDITAISGVPLLVFEKENILVKDNVRLERA